MSWYKTAFMFLLKGGKHPGLLRDLKFTIPVMTAGGGYALHKVYNKETEKTENRAVRSLESLGLSSEQANEFKKIFDELGGETKDLYSTTKGFLKGDKDKKSDFEGFKDFANKQIIAAAAKAQPGPGPLENFGDRLSSMDSKSFGIAAVLGALGLGYLGSQWGGWFLAIPLALIGGVIGALVGDAIPMPTAAAKKEDAGSTKDKDTPEKTTPAPAKVAAPSIHTDPVVVAPTTPMPSGQKSGLQKSAAPAASV